MATSDAALDAVAAALVVASVCVAHPSAWEFVPQGGWAHPRGKCVTQLVPVVRTASAAVRASVVYRWIQLRTDVLARIMT